MTLPHLLQFIRKSLSYKQTTVVLKHGKHHSAVLQKLVAIGLIKSFRHSGSFLTIVKLHGSRFTEFNSIDIVKHITISYKRLTKDLIRLNGHNSMLLHTDKGLITNVSATRNSVGGKLILKFN